MIDWQAPPAPSDELTQILKLRDDALRFVLGAFGLPIREFGDRYTFGASGLSPDWRDPAARPRFSAGLPAR